MHLWFRHINYQFRESIMNIEMAKALSTFLRRVEPTFSEVALATHDLAVALERLSDSPVGADFRVTPGPQVRGPRQQQIVDLLMHDVGEDGLKTGEVAAAVSMDQPNAYTTLQALQGQGIVEMVPGAQPQRWRLVSQYRRSRRIIDAANAVKAGEWTSYGEICFLTYGHYQAGLAVGRVMSTSPDVANAHRVLEHTGHIPDGWVGAGGGPDECKRRLVAEGVEVSDDMFAHMRHFVDHEVLSGRLA
jgi:alkylated DNA nucleotide flippase Atl1